MLREDASFNPSLAYKNFMWFQLWLVPLPSTSCLFECIQAKSCWLSIWALTIKMHNNSKWGLKINVQVIYICPNWECKYSFRIVLEKQWLSPVLISVRIWMPHDCLFYMYEYMYHWQSLHSVLMKIVSIAYL